MMQKFGTYEFLADLIPGLALLWVLDWVCRFFGAPLFIPIGGSLGESAVLIAWAFLAGLLIQGIGQGIVEKVILWFSGGFPSARWLLDGGPGLSAEYRGELKKAIGIYFGVPVEPDVSNETPPEEVRKAKLRRYQELFYLCYNLVDQKKLSDRPLAFNAHYGLFRALLTLSLLSLMVFGSLLIWKWTYISRKGATVFFGALVALLLVASLISFFRMRKRGEDFARSVYDLFFTFYRETKNVQG
jgi:hypothetical protein